MCHVRRGMRRELSCEVEAFRACSSDCVLPDPPALRADGTGWWQYRLGGCAGAADPDAPGLLRVIDEAFEVNRVGEALRLGPRSVDVMEGRAEVGKRVPPYTFYCKVRGHAGDYDLVMVLDEQGEGWQFTVRERGPRD